MRRFLPLLFVLSLITPAVAQQRAASITGIAPTFGAPGATVSIRGSGLAGIEAGSTWVKDLASEPPPGTVEFNGVPGDVILWQDNLISVKVPKGSSTGRIRVVIARPAQVLMGEEFEVYYSTRGAAPSRPAEFSAPESPRPFDRAARPESTASQFDLDERVPPGFQFYSNPWFSRLSPGERTFLGEQGFSNTFLFGNPFSLGRKQSFLFGGGFASGFGGFSHPGFDRFGFNELFFRNFGFRGFRNTSIRPFWFFTFR